MSLFLQERAVPETPVSVGQVQEFSRYEFKYLLNESTRVSIEEEIRHFMDYDGHVHEELENCYFVRSLYFDDLSASSFYEKIDGVKSRQKFRIRTYTDRVDGKVPVFLELKGRHNERSYKLRVAIDPTHVPMFCDPVRHGDLIALYSKVELVEHFVFHSFRRGIFPRVLVDYRRRPYTSVFDANFRLTFDARLEAIASGHLFPELTEPGWRKCNAGWTVLEVKFDRRIPAWFHRILQSHDMRRVSISKFCRGMETCELAVNLS